MKIKDGFVLRNVADNYIVIGVGEEAVDFNGMITLNETGAFLWKILAESDVDKNGLLTSLMHEYDVDADTVERDIDDFLKKLQDGGLLIS